MMEQRTVVHFFKTVQRSYDTSFFMLHVQVDLTCSDSWQPSESKLPRFMYTPITSPTASMGDVLMIMHTIVMRPLTSHPYKAGTEHAGFSPDQAEPSGGGEYSLSCMP